MEDSLLPREADEKGQGIIGPSPTTTWGIFIQEVKRLGYIAGPMVAVILTQYSLQVISMMMVGHLGELALSSAAMALSLSGVTGFSLMMGMASALETLCGQAYGAKQYKKLGTQTYTAIFCLNLVCIPLSVIWIYMGKILHFTGQDPAISHEAGKFTVWLVPSLFAYATLQPLIRYFQTQSFIMPMLISSCATLCFHIPLCWALVYKSGLKNVGSAVAMGISYWLNVIFLGLYIKYSSACAKTRVPVYKELFYGVGEFFRFAIPSAVMICLEWWSFELLILLSGFLPNPQLETSVLSSHDYLNTLWNTIWTWCRSKPLSRYLQIQSLTIPMLLTSVVTLLLRILLCWFLVFKSGLENVGGALAISISKWLNVIFLLLYMKYSSACAKTRVPVSMEMFHGIGEFFRFVIPSAVMICLQRWAYEIVVLLSGLLSNPQLETSVLSVCLTTTSTLYSIPYGIGAAVSTRVSNELGAGRPQAARIAVYTVMILAIIEVLIASGTLFGTRDIFGYSFSNQKEVN
ncbi:protein DETOXIFICATION 12-like [Populus alba x Populus x berolinensis]|nr:protein DETOXIFICATION 12-like [Populus alba x Populus x berolinensis]